MVSPVHGDYRRGQAETPLIDLFKFAEPAQKDPLVVQSQAGEIEDLSNWSVYGNRIRDTGAERSVPANGLVPVRPCGHQGFQRFGIFFDLLGFITENPE